MRILLVEDDLPLAEALTTLLLGAGYALDVTHDGLSAETLIGAERFDLVILDLNLPEKDGLSVLRSLRARKNPVPILILTARGEPAERVQGLDLGADDYMVKPFEPKELIARV
ncbi:MAG TPA: response regulator, partial [Tabrizicola sp.]|nr:response regulator [Tabrizicola sp.]